MGEKQIHEGKEKVSKPCGLGQKAVGSGNML